MHKLEQHITEELNPFRKNHLFVACSGGVDSTTLLHILKKNDFNLSAIHVNYQLRGDESELDAAFIERYCQENSVPFKKRIEPIAAQLEEGGNLQELARKVRYNWFEEILSADDNNKILLAHHQDDQVETFLMNIGRKSGVMGLSCMLKENGGYIRPLLNHSKQDVLDYALDEKLSWQEDKSNQSNKYTRNRLRNEFIPFLRREIPHIDGSIMYLVDQFQQLQNQIEENITPVLISIIETKKISDEEYKQLPPLEKIELFRKMGQPATIVEEIEKLTQKGTMVPLIQNKENLFSAMIREENGYSFYIKESTLIPELIIEEVNTVPSTFDKNEIYLDAEKISGKLKIRPWKIGDRMKPIGMKGSKLISDILSDQKLTFTEKENTFVVLDENEIHWCFSKIPQEFVGLKIGRDAIANPSSKKILKVSIGKTTL